LLIERDVDRTYISSLELSVYSPSIEVVDRLATALGVEAAVFLQKSSPGGAIIRTEIPESKLPPKSPTVLLTSDYDLDFSMT
jgi:hypothetical protein